MKEPLGEYMEIELIEQKPKTNVWQVTSKRWSDTLGIIKWYAPWRQYCFFPSPLSPVLSSSCLNEIVAFLVKVNKAMLKPSWAFSSTS
jgi:hypothetical protein